MQTLVHVPCAWIRGACIRNQSQAELELAFYLYLPKRNIHSRSSPQLHPELFIGLIFTTSLPCREFSRWFCPKSVKDGPMEFCPSSWRVSFGMISSAERLFLTSSILRSTLLIEGASPPDKSLVFEGPRLNGVVPFSVKTSCT